MVLKRTEIPKSSKVIVLFSISPFPCENRYGDEIQLQSYMNRLMWAKLKGYDVAFNRGRPDKRLSGPYSKIALTRAVLANESDLPENSLHRHEWLLWIDADALIVNMSFNIPFEKYDGKDFIVYGSENYIFENPDGEFGANTGVYLLRNTEWSREFMDLVATFGFNDGRAREEELKSLFKNVKHGLMEQNAIIYILNKFPKFFNKTFIEDMFGFNLYWKDKKTSNSNPFIMHMTGCEFCEQFFSDNCSNAWYENVKLAKHLYYEELARILNSKL